MNSPSAIQVEIIHNEGKGTWKGDSTHKIRLTTELEIGIAEGDETLMLGRVSDIAVDEDLNIYIVDDGFKRVQKYDSAGDLLLTFGRSGPGPGEFRQPWAIAVDEKQQIYVGDRDDVIVFDSEGRCVSQFDVDIPGGFIRGVEIEAKTGRIFVACASVVGQKAIHVYDHNHKRLNSFCDVFGGRDEFDARIRDTFAGGDIDMDGKGLVFYTQMTPYEIRVFSVNGTIRRRIFRDDEDMRAPEIQMSEHGTSMKPGTTSLSIVVLEDNKFINVLGNPTGQNGTMEIAIDLFNSAGELLLSQRVGKSLFPKCSDNNGRVYVIDMDDYPKVLRCQIVYD
ncbi:MAG: hypothetical protein JSW58_13455 [Candidatus Latescibacterota bacterium]|nr:MAG: hypothetical protein JSW58_13455 [Candidatus Latescibacterota bacterium]